jgi:hypothetical protein
MKRVNSITFQHQDLDTKYPQMEKIFLENDFYPNVGDIIVDSDTSQTNYKVLQRSLFIDNGNIDLHYIIDDKFDN